MTTRPRFTFHLQLRPFPLAMLALLIMLAPAPGLAQTFSVLYTFTGGTDGGLPLAGVTVGRSGTLYGATSSGGVHDYGVVFQVTRQGSGWRLVPLYEFTGNGDEGLPQGPVTVGPNSAVYGTTERGSIAWWGTVFELRPPATLCKTAICYWNQTVLHTFQGGANDGASPASTNLVFDQAGNLYGTTQFGGTGSGELCTGSGCGTVFELSPSNGEWTFSIIHSFNNDGVDGYDPLYGVIFDPAGNLYGTTYYGGTFGIFGGTAFELTPSGRTWTENIVHNFSGDPNRNNLSPSALIVDQSGNLYGSTIDGGDSNDGSVFELAPSQGSWSFSALYAFAMQYCGPGPIAMDPAGDFYGTCYYGGLYDAGWVFKLTHTGGLWTATDLHDFNGGSDGAFPVGPVVLDSNGNLYGTTSLGGLRFGCEGEGCGTIWEITP
jgi:uncharacterized repeat protein (TIGR03803 family)